MGSSPLESCRLLARPDIDFREFEPGPRGQELDDNAQIPLYILCDKCKELGELLQEYWNPIPRDSYDTRCETVGHYQSLGLLRDSFKRGCHLCTILWGSLPKVLFQSRAITDEACNTTEPNFTIKARSSTVGSNLLSLEIKVQPPGSILPADGSPIHINSSERYTHTPFTTSVSTISTKDATSRTFYRKCREICDSTHTKCCMKTVNQLPTRLLHIAPNGSNAPSVRLVLTGPEFSRDTEFAALSYCWGGRHGLLLEESNYQSLLEHIPFDELPATVQDSIRVTLELGMQYLWVDSLCIIQKQASNKDWSCEAGKMCDIYQGCSISIAASGASKCTEGLFAVRDPLRQAECVIGMSLITVRPHQDWALETRGWVLQEGFLPARSIKFGSYVTWTCRELSVNEFGQIESRLEDDLPRDFFSRIIQPQTTDPVDEGETYDLWSHIMWRYTNTTLSYGSDRLAAIEGLRSAFQRRTGWACTGGLWQSFIMRELLWCRDIDQVAEPSGLRPSWSWASMDGSLKLCLSTEYDKDIAKYVQVFPSSNGRVELDSPVLELSGVLCQTRKARKPMSWWVEETRESRESLSGEGWPDRVRLRPIYDDKNRLWTKGDMGLPLRYDSLSSILYGLIVVPSINSEAFERVGYFNTDSSIDVSLAQDVERLARSLEGSSGNIQLI